MRTNNMKMWIYLLVVFIPTIRACQLYSHDDQLFLPPFQNQTCLLESKPGTYPFLIDCEPLERSFEYSFEHPMHLILVIEWQTSEANPIQKVDLHVAIQRQPRNCNKPYSYDVNWNVQWNYYQKRSGTFFIFCFILLIGLAYYFNYKIRNIPFLFVEDSYTLEEQCSNDWLKLTNNVFNAPRALGLLCALISSGIHCWVVFILIIGIKLSHTSIHHSYWPIVSLTSIVSGLVNSYVFCNVASRKRRFRLFERRLLWNMVIMPLAYYKVWVLLEPEIKWKEKMFAMALWIGLGVPLLIIGNHLGMRMFTHREIQLFIQKKREYSQKNITIGLLLSIFPPIIVLFDTNILLSMWYMRVEQTLLRFFLVLVLYSLSMVLLSVFQTYYRLKNQNYHWWWSSFLITMSCMLWIILGMIRNYYGNQHYYLFHTTQFWESIWLFGFIGSLMMGGLSWFASKFFIFFLYHSLKVE